MKLLYHFSLIFTHLTSLFNFYFYFFPFFCTSYLKITIILKLSIAKTFLMFRRLFNRITSVKFVFNLDSLCAPCYPCCLLPSRLSDLSAGAVYLRSQLGRHKCCPGEQIAAITITLIAMP